MSQLKTGWAETDITPVGIVDLYGQYYQRVSKGIHSRLGATVMALESNGEQAVMISVDLTNFSIEFLNELRDNLKGKIPDIDTSKIIMNATHTHSAPGVSPGRSWWEASNEADKYKEFVIEKLSEAVVVAWNSKQSSGFANSSDFAVVGHNRRAVYENGVAEMYGDVSREDFIGMEGNEDSSVETVFFFDENRTPVGAIVNLACPSQVMEATYYISSDFMGEARRLMKEKFGDGFHTLCQISAAGCQSPRDLVRTKDDELWRERGVKVLGQRVFDSMLRALDKAEGEIQFDVPFVHSVKNILLPKRKASYKEYKEALRNIEELEKILPFGEAFAAFCEEVRGNEQIPGRPGPYDSKLHHFVLIRNNEAVVARYEEQKDEPDYEMELHALRIGNVVFVTNPFELFLDYGLQIKSRSNAEQVFVVQLACGSTAYLPTERAEEYGGYGALIINGIVGSDGGKKLVDETVCEIDKLF